MRLHPIPEWVRSLRISFPSAESTVAAAVDMIGLALWEARHTLFFALEARSPDIGSW